MIMMLPLIFINVCESCIVENYLPEFKGTYDETQDPLLAVDWEPEH